MKKPNPRRIWHVGYPWFGGTIAGLGAWRFDSATRVFQTETIETAVLGGLIALSGLIISVLLALLGLLVALEHREVIREIKRRNLYPDLMGLAFQPLVVFMLLAIGAVLGLLTMKEDGGFRNAISIGALAATIIGLLATLRFAIQLMNIMLDEDKTSSDADDGNTELRAARRRARAGGPEEDPTAPVPTRFESLRPA